MGNSDSHTHRQRHFGDDIELNQIPLSAYEIREKLVDPRYGEISIGEHITKKEKVAIKEQMFDSTSKFEKEYKELVQRLVGSHVNILQIYGYYHLKESHLCSSLHKMYIFVEYLKKDLSLEVKTRRLQNFPFSEPELWNFISDLINVMSYLQTLNVTHGNLRLNNIFIDANANTFKIADPGMFTNCMSNYTHALSGGDTKGIYLCPRLLRNLELKATFPKYNTFKSDVFSLGMIFLDVALLAKHENIIEWETLSIRKDILKDCLNSLKNYYSESLQQLIASMLILEEEKRPDFNKLSLSLVEFMERRKVPGGVTGSLDGSKVKILKESNEVPQYPSVISNFKKSSGSGISLQSKSQSALNTKSELDAPLKDIKNFKINGEENYQVYSLKGDTDGDVKSQYKRKPHEFEENGNGPFNSLRINMGLTEPRHLNPDYFSFGNQYLPLNVGKLPDQSLKEQEDSYLKYNPQIQSSNWDAPYAYKKGDSSGDVQYGISFGGKNKYNFDKRSELSSLNYGASENLKSVFREVVKETYDDGSIYEGEKENGQRHGVGKFYYSDGGLYDGEWVSGRMEGRGILYYPNAQNMIAYDGQWLRDKFHGKGTVYNESITIIDKPFNFKNFEELGDIWEKYEGDFREDCKDGIGTLLLSNGDRFTGKFVNDSVHGRGTYYKSDGEIISGEWMYNKLIKIF